MFYLMTLAVLVHPGGGIADPPFLFQDEAGVRGVTGYLVTPGSGGGVAVSDYDGDGWNDLFAPTAPGVPDRLFRNLGDGTFAEVAADVGVASTIGSRLALWLDHDGDADLDLLVINDDESLDSTFLLYEQVSPTQFVDVTAAAGLYVPMPPRIDAPAVPYRGGVAAGDVNNDGWCDLYVTTWNGLTQLLINRGRWFEDVTATAGVNMAVHYTHQPAIFDFDGDGFRDIYVAVDFLWNALYINNGDETFNNIAPLVGLDNAMNDMGMSLGDYDNDGDFDIYITNIFQPLAFNVMLRNESTDKGVQFVETAESLGVDYGGWGWGATFLDADGDGWQDIAATNGWSTSPHDLDKSVFYWNRGGTEFQAIGGQIGFNDSYWGSALAAFDVEGDGDPDLVQTCVDGPLRLLINKRLPFTGQPDHLLVRPRMDGPNHFAIGAVVRVTVGDMTMSRLITAGTSFLSQEPPEALFGIPETATGEVAVDVEWPDGSTASVTGVTRNSVLNLLHGGFGDLDADGTVSADDVRAWTECLGGPGEAWSPACRPADVDGSGAVDLADLAVILPRLGGAS